MQVPFQVPPFRLYGLLGCQHCIQAQQFFMDEQIPVLVIIGNDDPVAEAGVKWAMRLKNPARKDDEPAAFPLLVCTFGKQIVEGFNKDEYNKLVDAYRILFNSPRPSNPASGGQQPNGQATPETTGAIAGAA